MLSFKFEKLCRDAKKMKAVGEVVADNFLGGAFYDKIYESWKGCINLKVKWHYREIRPSILLLLDSFCRVSEKGQRRPCRCNKWGDIWTGAIRVFLGETRHWKEGTQTKAKGTAIFNQYSSRLLFLSPLFNVSFYFRPSENINATIVLFLL